MVADEIRDFLKTPFNRYLIIALLLLGAFLFFQPQPGEEAATGANLTIHYFYSSVCPHCAAQEPFNERLSQDFPGIRIIYHDVTIPAESRLLLAMAYNRSIPESSVGTPTTFVGNRSFIGFQSANTTGEEIRGAVMECLQSGCGAAPAGNITSQEPLVKEVELPLLGKTDLSTLSLPLLAVVLGLVDGFNPCAMWVLVYLIGLTMDLNDKRRLALIVGTFLLASGILYFLFMTAWLNAFLLLGYVRPVTILIGLVALGGGILLIKEYLDTKGTMVCNVTGVEGRKKLSAQMAGLISAPLTWLTLFGIIALAFTVNSIEFVCSSAIPAVFAQILAMSRLSALEHYGYIALYDFFYMLDDILVFGSALLVFSNVGEKYAKYCKMLGGAILLILGILLLFAPGMLR